MMVKSRYFAMEPEAWVRIDVDVIRVEDLQEQPTTDKH